MNDRNSREILKKVFIPLLAVVLAAVFIWAAMSLFPPFPASGS